MATIKDIAKMAGVSVTTVSRALNGYSDVNPKTRDRIKKVAEQLNYSPNALARSLVMSKSHTIGLLVSELNRSGAKDMFTYEVMCGINDAASDENYDLILFSTNPVKQEQKSYSQLCRERQVEGVIMQGIKTDDPYLDEVIESNIPCVLVDVELEGDNVGYVSTDNVFGAQMAMRHLINLGHENIAMMNGHNQARVSQRRLEGYVKALEEAGLPVYDHYVAEGDYLEPKAETEAVKLLTDHPEITAIFCASDLMALGVLRAAERLGRKVPEELSVVGYDDIMLAQYAHPPLTTVAQDKYQIGYESARLLTAMLQQKTKKRKVILDNQLIVRGSTAPPK
ncbi:LacI family DNA-binding transcriptional regulator [Bacillus sp. H-16]|uniref:LacI family DNA-binding transcriptional regulator n=1 Tax=Alteribacter salitolerans TaxID=2912333 RepID=UPI001963DB23|nr:LacI family DNA-binding transcriptional regulator [Alteribacter salitolerans]MBM7097539.1 LacI family DNA-binding transcriptional regulator [Alteribacter salitolerans]